MMADGRISENHEHKQTQVIGRAARAYDVLRMIMISGVTSPEREHPLHELVAGS